MRRLLSRISEPLIEGAIRICGWSAIFFVFAIFFFVFREAAPVLGELDLKEFFTSTAWRPDSRIRPQYGIVALLAGTFSVTILAMAMAVPAGRPTAILCSAS